MATKKTHKGGTKPKGPTRKKPPAKKKSKAATGKLPGSKAAVAEFFSKADVKAETLSLVLCSRCVVRAVEAWSAQPVIAKGQVLNDLHLAGRGIPCNLVAIGDLEQRLSDCRQNIQLGPGACGWTVGQLVNYVC